VISHDEISQVLKSLPVLNVRNIHSLASFIFIEGHTGMAANIRNVSFLTVTQTIVSFMPCECYKVWQSQVTMWNCCCRDNLKS